MKENRLMRARTAAVLLALAGLGGWGSASAAEYWLQTGTTTIAGVPMWGYALCGTGSAAPTGCTAPVTVPGPALNVPPGEGLVVHLTNTLPEPSSLVIASQVKQEGMQPVWFEPDGGATYTGARPAGNTTARVRSFDREAAPGGGTATYTWTSVRPGTYLYSSGTHPQVQVQMGLYGAMTKDAGTGRVAYSSGGSNIVYANQVTLVYSEIDPAMHAAVAAGTYGGRGGPGSTLEYQPKYFLINGTPFPGPGLDPLDIPTLAPGSPGVPAGSNLLIRFVNAGLKSHVPTINGQYWQVVAEDGNPVPFLGNPRQQYTAFLPPAKTLDVLLKPVSSSTQDTLRFAVFDSRLYDTSNGSPNGGMQFRLAVAPAVAAPPVFDTAPVTTATVGQPYTYAAHATGSAGHAVQYSLSGAPAGMSVAPATGLVSWPAPVAGSYPLTLRATDQVAPTLFADQAYTLVAAAGTGDAPVAVADTYTAIAHAASAGNQSVAPPGVLANDSASGGQALSAVKIKECTVVNGNCNTSSSRVTVNPNGSLAMSSSTATNEVRVTYRAQTGSGAAARQSADTLVTIKVIDNRAPVAAADAFDAPRCIVRVGTSGSTCRTFGSGAYVPVALAPAANDTDPDSATMDAANQLPLAVARVRQPGSGGSGGSSSATRQGGTVTVSGAGVTYVPRWNFTGSDTFEYRVKDRLGKESGSTNSTGWAVVTVQVN
ncbi:Ig-like domain-containing protein [Massilia sp. 2TAF26]|uniref:Ig-like domain-containing protein n=1 Tax=Massilia sp. 2TAF26 TaxID=3233012 RepID=UPI003F98DA40